jgi:hypothetical protein
MRLTRGQVKACNKCAEVCVHQPAKHREDKKISNATVNRYIRLYKLIENYPGLLVTSVTMSDFLTFEKLIIQSAEDNEHFRNNIQIPPKGGAVEIRATMPVFADDH